MNGKVLQNGGGRTSAAMFLRAAAMHVLAVIGVGTAHAAFDYRDTLEKVVAPPAHLDLSRGNAWDLSVADHESYDNDLYRLPRNITDLSSLGIPNASREDHINSATAGLDGQWSLGRQVILLNLRADDNRYARNNDLNYVSSDDKVVWYWDIGSALSGQLGADYVHSLAGFVNTHVYTRNIVDQSEYFAGARYQLGPHWAVFGGGVGTDTSLSAAASKANDSHQKTAAFGLEFATSVYNTVGLEYRYTDSTYPYSVLPGASNFHEDRPRFFVKYLVSDKTEIDANAGYLKRHYPSRAIGDFSGDVWHVSVQWQPTGKTQIVVLGWRELQAYFTADSDYYVSNGVSIAPVWTASEKINLSLLVSAEKQNYVGSTIRISGASRHDKVIAEQALLNYSPVRILTLNFSIRREQRESDNYQFTYVDSLASAGITVKF